MQLQSAFVRRPRPLLVSVVDGMAITSLGRTKFYELISAGRIKTVKVGAKTLVRYDSLEALAREGAPDAA